MSESIHRQTIDEVFGHLRSSPDGLSDEEAARRYARFGPNEVPRAAKTPTILTFLQQFTHFFAIILWIAAGLAFFAQYRQSGTGMGTLGAAIVLVIFINGLFSFYQQYRSENVIEKLKRFLPSYATILRSGNIGRIEARLLVPGDIVLLEAGELVPADCRLIESFMVKVNKATLTGESVPVVLSLQESSQEDILQASNVLLAGTSIVSGRAKAVVFATGANTAFAQIARLAHVAVPEPSPLQREIAHLSQLIAFIATILGLFFS